MTRLRDLPVFRRLAVAFVLAELIEWFALITLAFVVYDETNDALATTALFMSTKLVPSLLVPFLTARTERWANPRGIGALLAAEAVLFLALAWAVGDFSLVVVCALALLDGCIATLVRALTRASVALTLEPAGLLREGNAALNVGFAVMNVVGPSLAGLALALTDPTAVLAMGAGLLLLTGLYQLTGPHPVGEHQAESPWGERIREVISYVRQHRLTMTLILGEGLIMMFATLAAPIEVVFATETLDAGPQGFAALATSWGAGITIGSIVFARVGRRRLATSLLSSTAVMGIGLVGMGLAPTIIVASGAAVFAGAGNGVQWVSAVTAVQESVPASMQVRVAGLFEAVITLVPGFGYALGGLLAEAFSPRSAFVVSGAAIVVGAGVGVGLFAWRHSHLQGAATSPTAPTSTSDALPDQEPMQIG